MHLIRNIIIGLGLLTSSILFYESSSFAEIASPDLSAQLRAVEQTALTPAAEVPRTGQFYSAKMANAGLIYAPILPGGMGLDAWSLGDNVWLVNDLETVTPLRNGMQRMALDGGPMPPGADGGGGATNIYTFNGIQLDTNSLYLEITNVSSGLAFANLRRATGQVYAIWSATDLTVPLAGWQVETEVWPVDTNGQPFTVATLDRQNLFLRAQDWTGVTANGNTVPNWWLWNFFKTTDLSDTNLDNAGNSLLDDYENGFDPNLIQFSLRFASTDVAASPVAGTIDLLGGEPAYMAVLVNDTNRAHAVWQSYDPNVSASLTAGDGVYAVMVGLRGLAPDATPSWLETTLTLDTAPLVLTVTNPALNTVAQPLIQLQGFASTPLTSLTYDLTNAAGRFTNQPGFITGQVYDTNLLVSASFFQCYDLALTNGVNSITLHATDVFGHAATTNASFTLDYGSGANPVISLVWPANNSVVAGASFTLQGLLDDATAAVVVHAGTNRFTGLVERSGRFFVPNLPLSGTNVFTVAATNAAGHGISRTLTVIQSAVLVTVDPSPASQREFITVTGTVSDGSHDVYVNGMKATVGGDLTWSVTNVPVLDSEGSGQLTVNAYPAGSDTGVTPPTTSLQTLDTMQPLVRAVSYRENFAAHDDRYLAGYAPVYYDTQIIRQWANGTGGYSAETFIDGGSDISTVAWMINLLWPVYWPDGTLLNGTIFIPTLHSSDPYSAYSPSTWANATMAISGASPPQSWLIYPQAEQRQISRQAVTDVQLVAGGPALPGTSQLVRLLVSAAAYSDNGLAHETGYYNTYRVTGFEAPGDLPLPASAIQVLGQPVTPTATNAYVGELYVSLPAGATKNLPVNVTGTNSRNYSFNIQPEAVNFQLTVVSNSATQIDGTNWAVVKSSAANDYVYVQAMLDTTNAAALAMTGTAMQWTGGEAVPGNPLQRRISKNSPVETTVTARLNSTAANLNAWVVWADLTIKISGTLDPDDKAAILENGNFPTPQSTNSDSLGGGNSLGSMDRFSNTNLAYAYTIGKMEAKAVLQPHGIGNLLTTNWNMKRIAVAIAWDNGGSPTYTTGGTTPPSGEADDGDPIVKYLDPVNGDIFDLDWPACPIAHGATPNHTSEVYDNFYEYVTVNLGNGNQICSVTNTYSYTAQLDVDAPTNKVQLNSLSASLINLPTASHYMQR